MKKIVIALVAVFTLCPKANCQSGTIAAALQQYFLSQPREAAQIIEDAYQKTPDDPKIAAYYALLEPNQESAESAARKLTRKAPTDSWTLLAQAATAGFGAEDACNRAIAAQPENPDVMILATLAMTKQTNKAFGVQPLKNYLARYKGQFSGSGYSLMAEAKALEVIGTIEQVKNHEELLAIYGAAVKLNPNDPAVVLAMSTQLRSASMEKAYEFLKTHAASAPDSYDIHAAYWKVAAGLPDAKTKHVELEDDLKRLVIRSKPTVSDYYSAIFGLDDVDSALAEAFRSAIEKTYPDTDLSDAVDVQLALLDAPNTTVDQNSQNKIDALRVLLKRPKPLSKRAADIAKSQYSELVEVQEPVNLDELYSLVQPPQDFGWKILIKLADASYKLADLERIASAQVDDQFLQIRDLKKPIPDASGFVDFWLGDRVNYWLDALGYIYLKENKLDEAEHTLETAMSLRSDNATTNVHLGELYEARGNFPKAEATYRAALSMPSLSDEFPAVGALRNLYIHQHGSASGLDDYMKPILAEQEAMRKGQVLAARDQSPHPLPKFELTGLRGVKANSESLKGKYVIVNFWATWCGPCRAEHPAFEKLYEKYKNDPKVAIISVATDEADTPDIVIEGYMNKNQYQFPVLRGPDYATVNHISSIPLTWFIDPDGKIEFTKLGGTKELVEEFDWRLNAMRQSPVPSLGAANKALLQVQQQK